MEMTEAGILIKPVEGESVAVGGGETAVSSPTPTNQPSGLRRWLGKRRR